LLGRRLHAIDEHLGVEPRGPAPTSPSSATRPFDEAETRQLDSFVRSSGVVELGIVAEYGSVSEGIDLEEERQ